MCLAFPVKIIKLNSKNQATVDFDGVEKEINVSLIDNIKKGEFVIVHAGFAIERIEKSQKRELDNILGNI
jgi:hydrogenase expression/formation protein HypC